MDPEELEEIPFTDEHVEKIREGEKQTTMRTVKKENLFAVGQKYRVAKDLVVTVEMRNVLTFGPEVVEAFDQGTEIFPNTAAKHDALRSLEGFESIGDMIDWFEGRGYNLPQEFFLYRLNPMEIPETEEEEE